MLTRDQIDRPTVFKGVAVFVSRKKAKSNAGFDRDLLI